MKIYENNDICIITPLSPILDKRECSRIFQVAENNLYKKIAIDLSCVEDCTIDFLNNAKDFSITTGISFFNISADIFVLLNYMGLDKLINLFVSEEDFLHNTRRIIRRHFKSI